MLLRPDIAPVLVIPLSDTLDIDIFFWYFVSEGVQASRCMGGKFKKLGKRPVYNLSCGFRLSECYLPNSLASVCLLLLLPLRAISYCGIHEAGP